MRVRIGTASGSERDRSVKRARYRSRYRSIGASRTRNRKLL